MGAQRPKLVLLRPVNAEEGEAMYYEDDAWTDDDSGERYERVAPERDGYAYDDEYFGAQVPQGSAGRRLAAAKRRKIVLGLAGTFVGTLILGFAISMLWDITVVALIALVAYVGLMARSALAEGGTQHDARPSMADRLRERMVRDEYEDDGYDEYDDEYEDDYQAPVARSTRGERHIAHGVASATPSNWSEPEYFDEDEWYEEPRRAVGR